MLCLLLVVRRKKRRKKKRERNSWGLFTQDQKPETPYWLCQAGFLQLLGAIKG
jgi:hypothetical protein